MDPEALKALDALCRRATKRDLDRCPPKMVDASTVAAELYSLLQEFGPRETSGALALDDVAETTISSIIRAACSTGSFAPIKVLIPSARDELREYVKYAFISIQLLADAEMDYGPVPAGIRGRDLGLAALALEILQSRSPQRLIDQQRRSAH